MKTDYIYWNTFYEYLNNNFKLSGDLTHDAKVIKKTQYLWQEVSKRFLKKVKPRNLAEMWCEYNFSKFTYYELYQGFLNYLSYASDRMNINRWLYLQLSINKLADYIYQLWTNENNFAEWTEKIENGWNELFPYSKLQFDCSKEFKTAIKPLIVENQEKENENYVNDYIYSQSKKKKEIENENIK